jgi:hypothetical protein
MEQSKMNDTKQSSPTKPVAPADSPGFDITSHVAEEIEWTQEDERSANRAMKKLRRELGRGDDVP